MYTIFGALTVLVYEPVQLAKIVRSYSLFIERYRISSTLKNLGALQYVHHYNFDELEE